MKCQLLYLEGYSQCSRACLIWTTAPYLHLLRSSHFGFWTWRGKRHPRSRVWQWSHFSSAQPFCLRSKLWGISSHMRSLTQSTLGGSRTLASSLSASCCWQPGPRASVGSWTESIWIYPDRCQWWRRMKFVTPLCSLYCWWFASWNC